MKRQPNVTLSNYLLKFDLVRSKNFSRLLIFFLLHESRHIARFDASVNDSVTGTTSAQAYELTEPRHEAQTQRATACQ